MARVDVSTSSDLEPEAAWKLASDLRRFDEWMAQSGSVRYRGGNLYLGVHQGEGFSQHRSLQSHPLRRAEID
jgi:hypothetical protein